MTFEDKIRQTFTVLRAFAERYPETLPAMLDQAAERLVKDWYAEQDQRTGAGAVALTEVDTD